MSKKYIHYGDTEFKRDRFEPIANRVCFNKPHGGLWASPCGSKCNWYEWCIDNDFHTDRLNDYFIFALKDDARVLTIESRIDLIRLKLNDLCLDFNSCYPFTMDEEFYPDFEKLLDLGYDAIEVYIRNTIYWDLYGWDCDTLLVLNPDCVIEIQ